MMSIVVISGSPKGCFFLTSRPSILENNFYVCCPKSFLHVMMSTLIFCEGHKFPIRRSCLDSLDYLDWSLQLQYLYITWGIN